MENISLKSLVSQKTINEAEIDEGIFDTGWDAIKRAGAALVNQYNISKANGDEAAALRAKKKYDDWKAKVDADKKKDADKTPPPLPVAGKTPPPLPVDGGPTSADDINPELLGDPKTAFDVHSTAADTQLAAKTGTPISTGKPVGNDKSAPTRPTKPPMDMSVAKKLSGAVVKKLFKSHPNAVTPNTLGSYINNPVKIGAQLKASWDIEKRLNKVIAYKYSGDVGEYIKQNDVSAQDAIALLDIIRRTAGINYKDSAQFISSAFNGDRDIKTAITPPSVSQPVVPKKRAQPTQAQKKSTIKPISTATKKSPVTKSQPTIRGQHAKPVGINKKPLRAGKQVNESVEIDSGETVNQVLFTRSTSIPNMFRLS